MKAKKVMAIAIMMTMVLSFGACGAAQGESNTQGNSGSEAKGDDQIRYSDIELGKDYTDLNVSISFFNNRTDLDPQLCTGIQ